MNETHQEYSLPDTILNYMFHCGPPRKNYTSVTLTRSFVYHWFVFQISGWFQIAALRFQGLRNSDFRIHNWDFGIRNSYFGFHMSDFRFHIISGLRYQVPGFICHMSGFRIQVSGFIVQVSNFRFQFSGFIFQVSYFRFQISGFRFQVSDLRIQSLILGIWGLGNRWEDTGGTRPGRPQYQPLSSCIRTL